MILIDTSAWIEFLRDTGSPACDEVDRLLETDIASTNAIHMELLAGARDEAHLRDLRRLLARAELVPTLASDYEDAASLYRACWRAGVTPRKLIDCLIAAVAIRADLSVLQVDSDFDRIADCTPLQIAEPRDRRTH